MKRLKRYTYLDPYDDNDDCPSVLVLSASFVLYPVQRRDTINPSQKSIGYAGREKKKPVYKENKTGTEIKY